MTPRRSGPRPGRTWARSARDVQRAASVAERARLGFPDDLGLVCSCLPGCDELLLTDLPLPAGTLAVPHVEACPCRCDIC